MQVSATAQRSRRSTSEGAESPASESPASWQHWRIVHVLDFNVFNCSIRLGGNSKSDGGGGSGSITRQIHQLAKRNPFIKILSDDVKKGTRKLTFRYVLDGDDGTPHYFEATYLSEKDALLRLRRLRGLPGEFDKLRPSDPTFDADKYDQLVNFASRRFIIEIGVDPPFIDPSGKPPVKSRVLTHSHTNFQTALQ